MTYREVLDYLYQSLPMFQRVGAPAYKKGLGNILALSGYLGNPHRKFRTVHVGGTNGKGSTSHMLAAVLAEAGYKTGLYTSPHLKNFTERIRIDGSEISVEAVTDFVSRHKERLDAIRPSFFEMTVALAFDYFACERVDVAVVEVGLGGRLDSTNIIEPLLSVITNISFDHQAMLGDTLAQIAEEKAGIIKTNTPVVIGEVPDKMVKEVFLQKAESMQAPIFFAEDRYRVVEVGCKGEKPCFEVWRSGKLLYENLVLELSGQYQKKNLAGVLNTVEILENKGYKIPEASLREGLDRFASKTGLKGRWQKIGERPTIICDTAHNEAGIAAVMRQIKEIPYKRLFIIYGTVKDKDLSNIILILPRQARYFFCEPKVPRAMSASDLAESAGLAGLEGTVVPDVNEALRQAKRAAESDDLIVIFGSTFVVAEVHDL